MLRAIWLTIQNEARLLLKDPIVLFMLLLAPVVIIAVAGYSLGNLYGNANALQLPLVDLDRGEVATGIVDALRREHSVALELVNNPDEARRMVSRRDRTPLAIEIPAGTSEAVAAGGEAHLILFVDPVRRIEVNALELRIGELCRKVTASAQARAQTRLAASRSDLQKKLQSLAAAIKQEQAQVRQQMEQTQAKVTASVHAQTAAVLERAGEDTKAIVTARENQAFADVKGQLSSREAILRDIQNYLLELKTSQRAFEDWLTLLKAKAGSHASDIPAPPGFPAPPSDAELAALAKPITLPAIDPSMPSTLAPEMFSVSIPKLPSIRDGDLLGELAHFRIAQVPTLPGGLGLFEQPATRGGAVVVNAFDQYVPGFGVTFLLIGMLLGISLTVFDEREWGTLKRMQVSGAPLAGLLLGKLIARFGVGTVQMILLFAVGWALFGISLGREPVALLLPMIGISFAAASFGLVIAAVARAHDSVMPLGAVTSMAMSAIGGCWWPLDFEPGWMRAVARCLPTTWTMQSFNDLMIRDLSVSAVMWPFVATVGLGIIYLAAGIVAMLSLGE
ncbi:MAG TPA: ABC transporter permease [Candidatus Binataceae bacterium]